MKIATPPSKNVEDRSGDTSVYAPHRNPAENKIANESRKRETEALAKKTREDVEKMGKKNPFYDTLQAMENWKPERRKNANIPIPSERPDPSEPYTKPTVMLPEDIKGGMKPKPRA
jgi:hypothetical protein